MDLLTEERHSRSKLEAAVARELLALRQEIAKCQCANRNGDHIQAINQASLSNDTKVLEEEIIHLKRDSPNISKIKPKALNRLLSPMP
jgi:hypothetical protein